MTLFIVQVRYAGKQNTRISAESKPEPAAEIKPTGVDPAAAALLEVQVADQGIKVRDLKARKAEKDEIAGAVAALLDLKKRLATAQGVEVQVPDKKGKKKK